MLINLEIRLLSNYFNRWFNPFYYLTSILYSLADLVSSRQNLKRPKSPLDRKNFLEYSSPD